jgi:hypothetical protein
MAPVTMTTLRLRGVFSPPEVPMSMKLTALAAAAIALASAAFAPNAEAITITRGFNGLWHDTGAHRGFSAEVIDTANGRQLLAYWFTTDAAGKPLWVIGQGPIAGNKAVLAAVVGNSSSAGASASSWGRITVSFSDCAHGKVQFAPNDPRQQSGETTIARLSDDSSQACTGGISDDRTLTATSHGDRIIQFFDNTGAVRTASGKVRFEEREDRTDFKVEAEDLPIGAYSLRVAGVERATLNVATSANGTEGEIELRSPAENGHPLLDFDPRGQTIDVAQGGTVFLTTTVATESNGGGGSSGGGSGGAGGGDVARYKLRVEAQHDGPELKADFEDRSLRDDFSVELEDFAVGTYTLSVGGTERGTIDVVAVQGGTEGEIEFRDPAEPGHVLLDFDPRGQMIAIVRNGAVVLSGTFPSVPSAGGNGGSGGGGGNDDPPGDDHGGGGNDDPPGDDHGGHGGDDDHGGHGGHGGGHD